MPPDSPEKKPVLRSLAIGDVLFKEGDLGDIAYIVESGSIEISRFTGEEYITLTKFEEGALFGEMALIDNQPRSAMARATTETVVREVGKDDFLQYLKSSPRAAFEIMQGLADNVRTANENLSVDAFSSPEITKEQTNSIESAAASRKTTLEDARLNDLLDEFDPEIDRLRNKRIPRPIAQSTIMLAVIFVFLVMWAILSVIDTTVTANGRITTSTPNIDVQTNYNSVVQEVLVTRGQQVDKGLPLVIFDSTLQKADLQKLNGKVETISNRIERLLLELAMRDGAVEYELPAGRQRDIFQDRISQFEAKINSLDTNIERISKEMNSLRCR